MNSNLPGDTPIPTGDTSLPNIPPTPNIPSSNPEIPPVTSTPPSNPPPPANETSSGETTNYSSSIDYTSYNPPAPPPSTPPSVALSNHPSSGDKKFPILFVIILLLIIIAGFSGSFFLMQPETNIMDFFVKTPTPTIAIPTLPPPPQATPTAEFTNPFATPSATYKNPFETEENPFEQATKSAAKEKEPYQNPFANQ